MQRTAAIVLPPALLLAGLWFFAGRVTHNFRVSMLLAGLWIALLVTSIVLVAWRYRRLAVPVIRPSRLPRRSLAAIWPYPPSATGS
jgi:chromate transport protein ChrA